MPRVSYWAHSAPNSESGSNSRDGWQLLSVHLEAVARIARELASAARPPDERFVSLASLCGLFHDFGKYTDCFQQMLQTGRGRCQHAIHGAMLAYFGAAGMAPKPTLNTVMAAIAGHHAGLADWSSFREKLSEPRYRHEVEEILVRASTDCPELGRMVSGLDSQQDTPSGARKARFDLFVRMLFSCLVDADRLDSGGRTPLQGELRAAERLNTLLQRIAALQNGSPEGQVKRMRANVLEDCLNAASAQQRLFSLSVPTGGGKTLATMAFALRRAELYPERFRRVIVVIPYLSIIEQNAEVYSKVFGHDALLEHHSGSIQKLVKKEVEGDEDHFVPADEKNYEEEKQFQETGLRPETENWDAPLIVTTSVRFFESLFSNRPADLRRVHNIARSIVILDEVQTLPRRLLGPLLDMMKELAEDWDTNFVFSTATQPAFERPQHKRDLRWEPGTLTEIMRDPASLHRALKRVEIHWEIDQPVSWREIAQRMVAVPQCLAIVNVRDHASELYEEVLCVAEEKGLHREGVFHLSTRMCAAHRLRVLDKIRKRLTADEQCHVISTQLVEAGVDVDFPMVLRALAPLDSIIQAAGRADREGKRTAALGRPGGDVVVFLPEDHKLPPNEYKEAAGITEAIAKQELLDGGSVQVDSANAIRLYFERYYGGGADLGEKLVDHREHERFATLAQEFEMISNRTRDVFVPDDEEAQKAIERLRSSGELTPSLRGSLQRHVVGLSPSEFHNASGVVERVATATEDEIWVAVDQAYDKQLGLIFNPSPERLVL
ncbi:MAG: CRISPR-associated helicase Cas3' [Terracidiphilus sp.]